MIQIRNLMFQPLTLHLAGHEGGIHLNARKCRTISEAQLSDEIRAAASRGLVSLVEVHVTAQSDTTQVNTAEREHKEASVCDDKGAARSKKER